jgi:hypothetical protein
MDKSGGIGVPWRSKRRAVAVGSGDGVDSIQAREGSPAGNEGKNRRLMSSGVPFSGGPSEAIDDEARPRDIVMSSLDGGRSASGFLAGDGGADSYT